MSDAWAFLVARGRAAGYQTVLAPDFLTAHGAYGPLERHLGAPLPDGGPPSVSTVETKEGRLCVVAVGLRLTRDHLADAPGQRELVLDEHGRPLHATFGFVSRRTVGKPVHPDDIAIAQEQALAAYRAFLADESGFATLPSSSFALRSVTLAGVSGTGPRPAVPTRVLIAAGLVVVGLSAVAIPFLRGGSSIDSTAVAGSSSSASIAAPARSLPELPIGAGAAIPEDMKGFWAGLTGPGSTQTIITVHLGGPSWITIDSCKFRLTPGQTEDGAMKFVLTPQRRSDCAPRDRGTMSLSSERRLKLSLDDQADVTLVRLDYHDPNDEPGG